MGHQIYIMNSTHFITSETVTFEILNDIIVANKKLQLSKEVIDKINNCRFYLDEKIKRDKSPIYGINTGFGALCDIEISKTPLNKLQENRVISHACNIGPEVPAHVVKVMLLLKAHALAKGNSAVQLITVQRIIDLFNNDILPVVCEQGSLGASGDLAPLAMLFLPLLGLGEVNYNGKRQESKQVIENFGWHPIKLEAKEGLALLNGTQFMNAHGVYSLLKTFRIIDQADMIGALSLDAYNGLLEPFIEQIQRIRPHAGQAKAAGNFRKVLKDSQLQAKYKKHIQDPYSFRCIPQVHGAVRDAVDYAALVLKPKSTRLRTILPFFPMRI